MKDEKQALFRHDGCRAAGAPVRFQVSLRASEKTRVGAGRLEHRARFRRLCDLFDGGRDGRSALEDELRRDEKDHRDDDGDGTDHGGIPTIEILAMRTMHARPAMLRTAARTTDTETKESLPPRVGIGNGRRHGAWGGGGNGATSGCYITDCRAGRRKAHACPQIFTSALRAPAPPHPRARGIHFPARPFPRSSRAVPPRCRGR